MVDQQQAQADPLDAEEYDLKHPLPDRLAMRIARLKENRDRFITQAQRELSNLDAAIGELEALLDPAAARQRMAAARQEHAAEQNGTVGGLQVNQATVEAAMRMVSDLTRPKEEA